MDEDRSILAVASWRTRRGITLRAIADSTKISVPLLQAIEAGEFRKLPGGIYNTSYIRQYANAIDFDPDDLLAYYRSTISPATPNPSKNDAARPSVRGYRPLLQP